MTKSGILNKNFYYLFSLFILLLPGCEREVSNTTLTATCPPNLSVELLTKVVPSNSINLPLPTIVTNCENGDFTYTNNLPDSIQAGIYNVDYYISNKCGNKDTCFFQLTVTWDYRKPYLGIYVGNQHCDYSSIPNTDSIITVQVTLGETPNKVNVDGDEIIIDSTGHFPNPSCCGYRWYYLQFFPDSVHVFKDFGSLGSLAQCHFYGRKQ